MLVIRTFGTPVRREPSPAPFLLRARPPGDIHSACATLLLFLALASCSQVGRVRRGAPVPDDPGATLVFGRVRILEGERSIVPPPSTVMEQVFGGDSPIVRLSLFQVETGRKWVFVPYDEKGNFEWMLPRGTYLVYHAIAGTPSVVEALAAFQAKPGVRALYAGTLRLDIDAHGGEYSVNGVDTLDEFEGAWDHLLRHHPTEGLTAARSPMVTDPALTGVFTNWKKERCLAILARHGLHPLPPP